MSKDKAFTRFSVRFNLDKDEHSLAWEKLQQVESGNRSEYVIECILEREKTHPLEKVIMALSDQITERIIDSIQSSLSSIEIKPTINTDKQIIELQTSKNEEVSDDVLDFMNNL